MTRKYQTVVPEQSCDTSIAPEFGGLVIPPGALKVGSFVTQMDSPEWGPGWLLFSDPIQSLAAATSDELRGMLDVVELHAASGGFATGFLSYHTGMALDEALIAKTQDNLPLGHFFLYDRPPVWYRLLAQVPNRSHTWQNMISKEGYESAVEQVKSHLARGNTYQVNYSFPLECQLQESPADLFMRIAPTTGDAFGSYLETENLAICSFSPELFFCLQNSKVTCRPMKGTAPRCKDPHEDRLRHSQLRESPKEQAENIMIVDMIRNDLGRISVPGSVRVLSLLDVEPYPTVWQMTSTIQGTVNGSLYDIFKALFPCASVIGAPKVATSKIIAELERFPRGVYTGAMGYVSPRRSARFSVLIRTVEVDKRTGRASYGAGSGIVWDSIAQNEWSECNAKTRVLNAAKEPLAILETLLWTPEGGFLLGKLHLRRMERAAAKLGYDFDRSFVKERLSDHTHSFGELPMRVRLLLFEGGRVEISSSVYTRLIAPVSFCLARRPVCSGDPLLGIKSTERALYNNHLADLNAQEVLLYNERGELTEFCKGNLVLERHGALLTPARSAGLLEGVFRQHLLSKHMIKERRLTLKDLDLADRVWFINSVAGWVEARRI